MKDWKKELEIYKTNMGGLYGDGAWMANYYPAEVVETLLSEQEAEHEKQMREAIEEVGKELEDSEGDSAFAAGLETALDIFVKHNCEEGD